MAKKIEDLQSKQHRPMSEINRELARKLKTTDSRLECFLSFQPPPVYLRKGGYFRSKKRTKVIVGANKSYKTSVALWEDVMIYTGMIPAALRGVYAFEDDLKDMVSGPKRRPRQVRIIVQDYSKAFPETIEPMLLGDPEHGGRGFLPEAWSNYDKEKHMFHGPDGSFLSIMSVDPTQKIDPRKLRGPLIDHTHICENSLQVAYSESLTRSAGLKNGPRDVAFEFCPQDGYEDWTYKRFYASGYDTKTDERLPEEKCNPAIFVQSVTMRDNPDITEEYIQELEQSIPAYQVAFRIHGKYSAMAMNPYFHADMLQEWYKGKQVSDGDPYYFANEEVDTERGIFKGKFVHDKRGEIDEMTSPVWRLWGYPIRGEKYVLSADSSMGNPGSDFQSADILRLLDFGGFQGFLQVAQLRMRLLKPGDFAIQCAMAANYFGGCMLIPEVMGESGGTFVDRIRRYPNLYTRMGPPTKQNNDKPVKKLGWHTDRYSKPLMLETLYKTLQRCYRLGFCPINSTFTLSEMMSFEERIVKDKMDDLMRTEWGNRPGAHDDTVISMSIGNRIISAEKNRISSCNISDGLLEPDYVSVLEKDAKKSNGGDRAFQNNKPQLKLEDLRAQLYARSNGQQR